MSKSSIFTNPRQLAVFLVTSLSADQ